MLPFIHIGQLSLPTFGLLTWVAAVAACAVLYANFQRNAANIQPDADAVTIVASATLMGFLGAKAWHELQAPGDLLREFEYLGVLLNSHPLSFFVEFAHWIQQGYAWFGGMFAGIGTLLWFGRRFSLGPLQLLDLASPAAAVGYGMGRIACFVSGDGDYGIPSNVPWAMGFPNGLDPTPPGVRVHPTPIYELIFGLALGAYLWWRGKAVRPLGLLTGEFLVLSGIGRFLVEIIRKNPKIYFGMSNAQVASLATIVAGVLLGIWSVRRATRSGLAPARAS
jgi:phosphatidylglycerol---prolipoprotein diacylglyceryl transferase